jgi:hypothetical protein
MSDDYVKHTSPLLDAAVLLETVKVILGPGRQPVTTRAAVARPSPQGRSPG